MIEMELATDPRVQRVLNVIEIKKLTEEQLRNLYENVCKDNAITEADREIIISRIELKLRSVSPRLSKKIFGPKDSSARMMLEEVHDRISNLFDLSSNKVGNGVKTGGDMIAGRAYVDVYVSYKNKENWHVGICLYQASIDSPMICRVRKYNTSDNDKLSKFVSDYSISEFDVGVDWFINELRELCNL
jgi:hypothetical protein